MTFDRTYLPGPHIGSKACPPTPFFPTPKQISAYATVIRAILYCGPRQVTVDLRAGLG